MSDDPDVDLHIGMANDATPFAVINGKVIPSGHAMRKTNEYAAKMGQPPPYPSLGLLRVTA